ncbi:hypothetical protein EWM64_g1671 [Hericium alpestre]|uniref:Uncharacterized protein n=1 Tax=Hericium alpestre TaxID=135208 RepID=A0A4Z0A5L6_9AGAM|nr:hypothetical protein EWM64_g1671 [Hericium alpestre]
MTAATAESARRHRRQKQSGSSSSGYDRERREAEEHAKEAEALELKLKAEVKTIDISAGVKVTPKPNGSNQGMECLRMSMKWLGFGGIPSTGAASTPSKSHSSVPVADNALMTARSCFGGQNKM